MGVLKDISDDFSLLSGGEKQKILIAKVFVSEADILFFDEPTNNMDTQSKEHFCNFVKQYKHGIVIVTHDRELLNKMDFIMELTANGIRSYGGNYDFYVSQKELEKSILEAEKTEIDNEISRLKSQKNRIEEVRSKSEAQGKKAIVNHKRSRVEANALKGQANISASKKGQSIFAKLNVNISSLQDVRLKLKDEIIKIPAIGKPFTKKNLLEVENITFFYGEKQILKNINFTLSTKDRVLLKGNNGTGKTTLIKIIMGQITPSLGKVKSYTDAVYLDQSLSFLEKEKSILDNILKYTNLNANEAYAIAANFKFRNENALKLVKYLSGGELLKATLAVILGSQQQPYLIILDEPTNNLDLKSIKILEEALNQYEGALIVVSHDQTFKKKLQITKEINLNK